MAEVLIEDEVLDSLHDRDADASDLVADSERLVRWADDESVVLDGRLTRASLLVMAGTQLGLAGRHVERLEVVDRAVALGDDTGVDLRIYRASALADAGRTDEAAAVAEEVRRSRPRDPFTCLYLADTLTRADLPTAAERWYTIGLRLLEDVDPEMESTTWDDLLIGRRDVRRAQGKAPDSYDADADAVESLADEGF